MNGGKVERRLAAIVAIDVAGYSRLMSADEEGTLARLKAHRAAIDPIGEKYGGRIVGTAGDGLLLEFPSVVDAVNASVEAQGLIHERNQGLPDEKKMEFRLGVNLGDVMVDGDNIYGDGVNIAARLEGLAEPGGVCLSNAAYEQIRDRVEYGFEDLGEVSVKNIARPVRTWRWRIGAMADQPAVAAVQAEDRPCVAVLPFNNMSGDDEQEYFADGISEDIITALSRFQEFLIIARNTTFTYKGTAVDIKQVAGELGARYVLEGSVRKGGNRVRITAQLIDADTGNHLWAERYDRELDDIFAVQDEITEAVVGAIEPQIYAAERLRGQKKAPSNLGAWDCVTRALFLIDKVTREDFQAARELLDQAIALDPDYALAYSLQAFVSTWNAVSGWGQRADRELARAEQLAQRALALDADDAWAHYGVGFIYVMTRRSEAAIAAMRTVTEINPGLTIGQIGLGMAYAYAGRSDEAVAKLETVLRTNPRGSFNFTATGFTALAHFLAGRHDRAIELADNSIRERPDFIVSRLVRVAALGLSGAEAEAGKAVKDALAILPETTVAKQARFFPISDDAALQTYLDGLRQAGMPED
ncbi:MAG: tetratricopeptide repeat protein [Alphaproteobacteria bacterium]|nr:tetratricopeptide repeat protein [Alphaproteobacteria bacterium]